MIYLISGEGRGAGKTTFARKMGGKVYSLAGAIRADLERMYPAYPWHAQDQETKDNTRISEWDNLSMREVMVRYGQSKCIDNPAYWAIILGQTIANETSYKRFPLVVDDVRKIVELDHFHDTFGKGEILHFHIVNPLADAEDYDNRELMSRADYLVTWQSKNEEK